MVTSGSIAHNEEGIKEVNIFLGLLAQLFVKPQM